MAQQDVRYYLNGMMFEIQSGRLRAVATDGHRLAMSETPADVSIDELRQVIIPRKGVLELNRLFSGDSDEEVRVVMSSNHIRTTTDNFTFTSKLIDGKFPDYQQVIPKNNKQEMLVERELLRQVLSRTAILSNEKYRGVRLIVDNDLLQVFANNPEQEEAEESLPVKYEGDPLEIGFNVSYLLDVLSVIASTNIRVSFADANSSILIEEIAEHPDSIYVVMPMRL
jgi:DNA polymerase-3 subunit beta